MGIFDKVFGSAPKEAKVVYSATSDFDVWYSILFCCMRVDGKSSEAEMNLMHSGLLGKRRFSDSQALGDAMRKVYGAVNNGVSLRDIIDACCASIKNEDKPIVFAMAADLVLMDGNLQDTEKEMIEYISDKMNLDKALAERIIEVTLIRNTGNIELVGDDMIHQ